MGRLDKYKKPQLMSQEAIRKSAMGMSAELDGEAETISLPVASIAFHENNDYRDLDQDEDIDILADDIERNGLLHNLVVTKRSREDLEEHPEFQKCKYVLLSGERRLRAIQKIRSKEGKEGEFVTVPCLVVRKFDNDPEIRRKQEMIFIDAANLQVRGSISGVRQMAKYVRRYIDNLMAVYGITEKQAAKFAKEVTQHQADKSISRIVTLSRDLIPGLYELFLEDPKLREEKVISQEEIQKFAKMNPSEQMVVNDSVRFAMNSSADSAWKELKTFKEAAIEILDLADDSDEDVKNRLNILRTASESLRNALAPAGKKSEGAAVRSSERNAAEEKRKKYLKTFEKTSKQLQSMMKKRSIKLIVALDNECKDDSEKIRRNLDQLANEINYLRDLLDKETQ